MGFLKNILVCYGPVLSFLMVITSYGDPWSQNGPA